MMQEANPEGGFEEVSKLILRDRPKWFQIAEEMTRKHAKSKESTPPDAQESA